MTFKTLILGSLVGICLLVGSHTLVPVLAQHPLTLAQVTPNPATSLTTVTGELTNTSSRLGDGSYFNTHTIEGTAGETLIIDLVSDAFDAYLIFVEPGGTTLAEDDDGGGGSNAQLVVTLPSTGSYQILVNTYAAGETGYYRLSWQPTHASESAPSSDMLAGSQRVEDLGRRVVELYRAGRYGEAIPLAQEVLMLRRRFYGETHPLVATSLNNLAALYRAQGRYDEAEPLFRQALDISRGQLGEQHLSVATGLNNLAGLYQAQGRYDEAEPLFRQALEIRQSQLGDQHPAVATSLNNLAELYRVQGRYSEAEPLYQQSLEIYREQLGEQHPNVATSLNNLAGLYQTQGRYTEAVSLFRQALEIRRERLGEHHPDVATSLNNLASLYQDQRYYQEAESLYRQALEIRREQLGERHPEVATSLNNLAELYRIQARYGEAEPLFQQALSILREQLGERHADVGTGLNNLALLYLGQHRYPEAELAFRQALAIRQEQLGEWHPNVAVSLRNLAVLDQAQGDSTEAIARLQAGLDIEERNLELNLASAADAQRQAYVATLADTTDQIISLHLQSAADSPIAAQLALTTLLRRKGRLLDAAANSLQTLRQHLTPDDQALLDQLIDLRRQLATLTFNPPVYLTPEQYDLETARLEQVANRLEVMLARRSATFRVASQPIEIADIQAQLPATARLVEYVRYQRFNAQMPADFWGEWRYAAYVLSADGVIHAVDLGEAEVIDAAVQAFANDLRHPDDGGAQSGMTLRALIVDPLLPYLQQVDRLFISPDSQLNRIPFEALPMADRRYWVEQYPMSYLNTGRDLLKLGLIPPSDESMVIMANPDYAIADQSNSLQFGRLPGTAAEAVAIQALFPDAVVLTNTQATETLLKAVQTPGILHIATHGFFLADVPGGTRGLAEEDRGIAIAPLTAPFLPNDPYSNPAMGIPTSNPLLRSGLALAGFNRRQSGPEDGVLTALEASSLNLYGTQLVVLSACETGLGEIANGEGVYGLRRAFALAGAESQLMSLWQVSDQGTQQLMTQYYRNLKAGMGRSDALRQVQLDMIRSGGSYSHPYYWAAFILTGAWQPL